MDIAHHLIFRRKKRCYVSTYLTFFTISGKYKVTKESYWNLPPRKMKGKRVSFSEIEQSLTRSKIATTRRISLQENGIKSCDMVNPKLEKYRNLLAKVLVVLLNLDVLLNFKEHLPRANHFLFIFSKIPKDWISLFCHVFVAKDTIYPGYVAGRDLAGLPRPAVTFYSAMKTFFRILLGY